MVEMTKLRPDHYEILGLARAASNEEIAKAFAKELGLIPLRPFGNLAEVSVAYETLRDPVKRTAYDASLSPRLQSTHPLIERLERTPVEDGSQGKPRETKPLPSDDCTDVLQTDPRAEAVTAPSSAAFLRKPAKPSADERQPIHILELTDRHRADRIEWHELERQARVDRSLRPDVGGLVINTAVAGALLLAIVLGAWTGLESGNDNEQALGETVAELPLPLDTALPTAEGLPDPAPTSSVEAVLPERPKLAPPVTARIEPARPPLQIELPGESLAKAAPTDQETVLAEPVAEAPAEAAAAQPAKLPLPNAVIARTIGRIGYQCGQVASIIPVEGEAAGAFKVTCTSGHSYRAAPVRGRYHFRRLGNR